MGTQAWSYDVMPGCRMPQDSGYKLLSALSERFAWIHGQQGVQIGPIRGHRSSDGHTLETDARSKLHVRGLSADQALALGHAWVRVDGVSGPSVLAFGPARQVDLRPRSRLFARLVILREQFEEADFIEDVERIVLHVASTEDEDAGGLGVRLGRRRALALLGRHYLGWSVSLDGLPPKTSLALQDHGLGRFTSMGCGVLEPGWEGPRKG